MHKNNLESNTEIKSIFDTASLIYNMEIELGLLTDDAYGPDARYIWEAKRKSLHNYLNRKILLFDFNNTPLKNINKLSFLELFYYCINYSYSILFKNWLWAPRNREWLVVQFRRKKKNIKNNLYEDIFTYDLINEIGIENCTIIDIPFFRKYYKQNIKPVFNNDFVSLLSVFIKILLPLFYKYNKNNINKMKDDIFNYINSKTGLNDKELYSIFKEKTIFSKFICYLLMLKWLKPKRILFVQSLINHSLILAALKLKIPIVELQHGIYTSKSLQYCVPQNMTMRLFPDYFLFLGKFYKEIIDDFILPSERSIILGNPYFERMKNEYKNVKKIKNQILIISQSIIGDKIANFTLKLASLKQSEYNIIYKLHPAEYGKAKIKYPLLFKAQEHGLLEVIYSDTPSLYFLLAQSYWLVSVSSSCIFEGIAMDCQTILVDLSTVETMEPLIKGNYVQLVKEPEEIDFNKTINTDKLKEDLFASDWRSNWREFNKSNIISREV